MLVFGVDIPLVEVVLVFAVIIFILLAECLVIIGLLVNQMSKTRKLAELVEKLSGTILAIKKSEIDELERIRKK